MAHVSGNATWADYPSTSTQITAATLEALENALDAEPRGVVGRRARTVDATTTSGVTETRVMWAAASVISGRYYRVSAPNCGVYGSASSGFTQVNLRYTTDGTTVPTTASTQLAQAVAPMPVAGIGYAVDVIGFYTPGSNQSLRVGLSYSGSAGNNAIMQGGATYPIMLVIEDMGIDPGNSGANL